MAGVPCAGTSTVVATGNSDCAPGAAICPQGDYDIVTVTVTVKDCYGTPLSGKAVTCYPDPAATGFCWCTGEESKSGTTDGSGVMTATFQYFGGCGDLSWYADSESIVLGPSATIYIASPDNNGDCTVNLTDFVNFAGHYFTTEPCSDFNCDGTVNLTDFVSFAGHYFHACP
jgi:hypothetical protein